VGTGGIVKADKTCKIKKLRSMSMYMVIVIEVSHKHRATLFSETPKPEA